MESKIAEGEELFSIDHISIDDALYVAHRELSRFPWERVEATNWMKAPSSEELRRILDAKRIPYDIQRESRPTDAAQDEEYDARRQRFEAVRRWFNDDWHRIEPKLKTSIVEGISVFLSLFDDNPAVKRTFCPPKNVTTRF